jgi:hypothetical protein
MSLARYTAPTYHTCFLIYCRRRHIHSETVVRTGPNGDIWLDREYHPRGVARWGARARLVGQDANDPRHDGKGTTPQQLALMAAAAKSLANAKDMMIACMETIETTEVMSTEQLVAARTQLGGRRTQRKAASVAAHTQLEAATAQLAQAEVEFAAAAKVEKAPNPTIPP